MGVDDRAALTGRDRRVEVSGGDDLGVHLVGDQVGAGARRAADARLERVHLGGGAGVDDGGAPAALDDPAGPGQGAPGLAADEQRADGARGEIDAHPLGDREQVHRVRRRRGEHRRAEPGDELDVLLRVGHAEREHGRADPFQTLQHPPAAEEQPERKADLGDVVRPDPGAPLGHRVHVGGAVPVGIGHGVEGGRPGGARRTVDPGDPAGRVLRGVAAERRVLGLVGDQHPLGDHRDLRREVGE
ncbi:hypothetical protein [Pseudonocardia sp. NPDC046786]|uniref:hypothetical protein n=1 Tax=Pseudonocardia sp. NPDC046786 TaxID=3155471 RepID=UPI0033D47750